jgi:Ca2+-binding RTX toxin-like protein
VIGPDAIDTFQVTTTSIQGTTGNDNFYVRVNGSAFEVFTSIPPTGSPTYTVPITDISSLAIAGDLGNDVVELGTPLPFDPVFTGAGGTDRLTIDIGNRTFSGDLLGSGIEELVLGGSSNVTFTVPQHSQR